MLPSFEEGDEGNPKSECFAQVIEQGRVAFVGKLPGALHNFHVCTPDKLLAVLPRGCAKFLVRTGVMFAFKTGWLHTRSKAVVIGAAAIQWLASGFPILQPVLERFKSGRMVA